MKLPFKPITVALSLTACLFVLSITFLVALHFKIENELVERQKQHIRSLLKTSNQSLDTWFKKTVSTIQAVSYTPIIRDQGIKLSQIAPSFDVLKNAPVQHALRNSLQPHLESLGYEGYIVIGPQNINLASSQDENLGFANLLVKQPETLRKLWSGKTTITQLQDSDIYIIRDHGNPSITFFVATRILGGTDLAPMIFCIRINPYENFFPILSAAASDNRGRIIPFNDKALSLNPSDFGKVVDSIPINKLKIIQDTTTSIILDTLDHGESELIDFITWNSNLNIGLSYQIDRSDFFYTVNVIRNISFTISGILFLALLSQIFITIKIHSKEEESIKSIKTIFENANDGIFIIDYDSGIIRDANQRLCEMTGHSKEDLTSMFFWQIKPESSIQQSISIKNELGRIEHKIFETEYLHKNGNIIHVEISSKIVNYLNKKCIMSIVRDITERKNHELELSRINNFDRLTGLKNRNSFIYTFDYLAYLLVDAAGNESKYAVTLVDINDFSAINDLFGHSIGDTVLKEVALRLKNNVPNDTDVYRLQSDVFLLVTPIKKVDQTSLIIDIIDRCLSKTYNVIDQTIHLSGKIGIAIYPNHGVTSDEILRSSDIALHRAKKAVSTNIIYYTPAFQKLDRESLILRSSLNHALKNKEFHLLFQPIVNSKSKKIVSAEALIRWNSPEHGRIPPDKFISIAEESGKIVSIGEWIIDEVCQVLHDLYNNGRTDFKITVNISPVQLLNTELLRKINDSLDQHRLPRHALGIEVTEGLFIHDNNAALKILKPLRESGIDIYMDDFGTGFSSLSYLTRFPFSILKIDRAFIQDLEENPADQTLVKSIIVMAKELGLKVVAEGVEDKWQANFLLDNNCNFMQGYYFHKPLTKEALTKLLPSKFEPVIINSSKLFPE